MNTSSIFTPLLMGHFPRISILPGLWMDGKELDELFALIQILESFLPSGELDKRVWGFGNTGSFSWKPFFEYLTTNPHHSPFPLHSFIWKAKVPHKVWAFSWTAVLDRVNTNNLQRRRRPNMAILLDVRVM